MKRFSSRSAAVAVLTLLGLSASTLLTGCFGKDGSCTPKGSTCDVAATVVDLSKTTCCGLALHLADSTYIVPTGSTWTDFHALAGQKLLVGYTIKKNTPTTCPAGPVFELGCISVNTSTTAGAN